MTSLQTPSAPLRAQVQASHLPAFLSAEKCLIHFSCSFVSSTSLRPNKIVKYESTRARPCLIKTLPTQQALSKSLLQSIRVRRCQLLLPWRVTRGTDVPAQRAALEPSVPASVPVPVSQHLRDTPIPHPSLTFQVPSSLRCPSCSHAHLQTIFPPPHPSLQPHLPPCLTLQATSASSPFLLWKHRVPSACHAPPRASFSPPLSLGVDANPSQRLSQQGTLLSILNYAIFKTHKLQNFIQDSPVHRSQDKE